MRIAVLSTPFIRVPPQGYGGTELFCGHLGEELFRRGHNVTLYATGDSEFSGALRSRFGKPVWPPSERAELSHVRFAISDMARDPRGYDAVQVNCPAAIPLARALGLPIVCTLHHRQRDDFSRVYSSFSDVHYVAISKRQLELEVPLPRASVIHHGVDPRGYPVTLEDQGYLLHLGRFASEKGTHIAIDAALGVGLPIVLAGRVHESDSQYFERELAPRIVKPGVVVAGEVDFAHKLRLLGGTRALLCPIEWEEPFGLVAIEAMLTGTPIIGFPRGSFPEIIEDGITGYLVRDIDEMKSAIRAVYRWDRKRCERRARQRFSVERMADEYEALFTSMAECSGDGARIFQTTAAFSQRIP